MVLASVETIVNCLKANNNPALWAGVKQATDDQVETAIKFWAYELREYTDRQVKNAYMEAVKEDGRRFPPTVGEVRKHIKVEDDRIMRSMRKPLRMKNPAAVLPE